MEFFQYAGFALCGVGVLIFVIFSILLIVRAFQTSVGWGLAYLFLVGIGPLAFVITHWSRAGGPFFKSLGGAVITGVGMACLAMGMPGKELMPLEEAPPPPVQQGSEPGPGQTPSQGPGQTAPSQPQPEPQPQPATTPPAPPSI